MSDVLKNELANDPNKIGYSKPLQEGNYEHVANLLNAPRYDQQAAEIDARKVRIWGAQNGRCATIYDCTINGSTTLGKALKTTDNVSEYRSYAMMMWAQLNSDLPTRLDNAEVQNVLSALVDKKVLQQSDMDDLLAMGITKVSRMYQLTLTDTTLPQTATADLVQQNA